MAIMASYGARAYGEKVLKISGVDYEAGEGKGREGWSRGIRRTWREASHR